jgi:hypothetical protein
MKVTTRLTVARAGALDRQHRSDGPRTCPWSYGGMAHGGAAVATLRKGLWCGNVTPCACSEGLGCSRRKTLPASLLVG